MCNWFGNKKNDHFIFNFSRKTIAEIRTRNLGLGVTQQIQAEGGNCVMYPCVTKQKKNWCTRRKEKIHNDYALLSSKINRSLIKYDVMIRSLHLLSL